MLDPKLAAVIALVAHWVLVIGFSVRVIMRRRAVGVTLAWIALILSTPLFGIILYLLIGENRMGEKRRLRAARIHESYVSWIEGLRAYSVGPEELAPLSDYFRHEVESLVGFPALGGSDLRLLSDVDATFDALIDDIDATRETCHLESYIWWNGGRADEVADAMVRARERGVACRVLLDAVGSKTFLRSPRARAMRDAGVELVAALPANPLRALFVRADIRNHRKLVVIDHEIAYTGSQNIVDPRFFKANKRVGQWIDCMVRLTGRGVETMAGTFLEDWEYETGRGLDILRDDLAPTMPEPTGDTVVQTVPSGPGSKAEVLHHLTLSAIYSARRELIITTPYFVPHESIVTALRSAAQRGVETTIILPRNVDSRLVALASSTFLTDLALSGVRIAQFDGGLLHSKLMTIDQTFCLLGSVNIDMRSLWLNFELSIAVYDAGFTLEPRELQQTYLARTTDLELETWQKRPFAKRLVENTARLFGPLL